MPALRDLLPTPPWEGPPLPRVLLKPEASSPPSPPAAPSTPPAAPPAEPVPARTSKTGEPVLVMRTFRDPTWLKEHQEKLARYSKRASELTRHIKGAERVTAMHRIISDLWREGSGPGS